MPAFDLLTPDTPENSESGGETTNAQHFTDSSLRHATRNPWAQIESDAHMYWRGGHGADEDPAAFIAWIKTITDYRGR